ncbi:hypothetical protein C4F40_08900 [Sphingobacterium sp. Ka21]|uniref:Lipoprotein n=2 Tax=Sphingobacterium pedocola TaxID=2082722 RepID=A0ABR9T670_9SPHI|nr:hypothetical protein [Sphingobacterium pedocola]
MLSCKFLKDTEYLFFFTLYLVQLYMMNFSKLLLLSLLLLLLGCGTPVKELPITWNEYIRSFSSDDGERIGYIDESGDTVLPPVYNPIFCPPVIYTVGAVSSLDTAIGMFYLNKNGKKFGRDSLWAFDFSYDVESDGFIRFSVGGYPDRNTEREGLYDWKGNIRVPSEYNQLSSVKNGMLIGKKDAKSEPIQPGSEYWNWVGGKKFLLDTNGVVLVDDLLEIKKINQDIDFYSKIEAEVPLPHRVNIKTVDGKYLSFINLKEEFKSYLKKNGQLGKLLLDTLWVDDMSIGKTEFLSSSAYSSMRELITKAINLDSLDIRYDRFPRDLTNTFLKDFQELVSSDQFFRRFPVLELTTRRPGKTYELLFVRDQNKQYKLFRVEIYGNYIH